MRGIVCVCVLIVTALPGGRFASAGPGPSVAPGPAVRLTPDFAPQVPVVPPELLALDDPSGRLQKFEGGTKKKDSGKKEEGGGQRSGRRDGGPSGDGGAFRESGHRYSGSSSDACDDGGDDFSGEFLADMVYGLGYVTYRGVRWFFAGDTIHYERPYRVDEAAYAEAGAERGSFAGVLRLDEERLHEDLWATHGALSVRLPDAVNLDVGITEYAERVPGLGHRDHLNWQTYTVSRVVAADGWLYASVGAGAALLSGEDTHAAFALRGGVDLFPADPVGVHLDALLSSVGEASLTELEGRVGWHHRTLEVFAGWRGFLNSKAPDLSGPIAGLAWWF